MFPTRADIVLDLGDYAGQVVTVEFAAAPSPGE
jgi:hypothetical protein